jgi:WD40 repeat protein
LPGDLNHPLLQLQARGPTAAVTSLAFARRPDGQLVLYAAGFDKVVRSWLADNNGTFVPDRTYRVPLGPGVQGAINAIAVTPDGRWLAAAGKGVIRGEAGFFDTGIIVPHAGRMSEPMLKDEGTIYLFDTVSGKVTLLRGHRGAVQSLAFAPVREKKHTLLVSAAGEEVAGARKTVCRLRLWDAETGELLASSRAALPDPQDGRPGLAAWHTGGGGKDLRVALACTTRANDQQVPQRLRVWDPAANQITEVGEPLLFNEPLTYLATDPEGERGTLFGAGNPPDTERPLLFAWTVAGLAPLRARGEATELGDVSIAEALALLPARPGDRPDHVAVVHRFPRSSRTPGYRLALWSLRGEEGRALTQIWPLGTRPALAASPDGRFLALARGREPHIRVYRAAAVFGGEGKEQILRSDGESMDRVRFVRQGRRRGLLLQRGNDQQAPDRLVFDLPARQLVKWTEDWAVEAPAANGWQAIPEEKGPGLVVRQGEETVRTLRLRRGQGGTQFALLPPGAFSVPLLAIGYIENSVPYLGLWDVQSGKQVRQFTGHVGVIRWLAFDAAGKRLVSAADDQTVRVWSLDDVGETLGKGGAVHGFAARRAEGGLRVARLDRDLLSKDNRMALAKVVEGAAIDGLVVDGKLQTFTEPQAFYEAVWGIKPGSAATVRIAGRDVELQVDQGTDERKPLFTLFITAGKDPAERRWVGWHPQGPYDATDGAGVESHIGWHCNKDNPQAPTEFAEADAHRKEYHREGILRHLLDRGDLKPALREWEKEAPHQPRTRLNIDGIDPLLPRRDPDGNPIVQHTQLMLQGRVEDVHPYLLRKVEWQLLRHDPAGPQVVQDGLVEPMDEPLQVDLSDVHWQRGLYEVRVAVSLTLPGEPTRYESLKFRYLPPQPRIHFPSQWLARTFDEDAAAKCQPPDRFDTPNKKFRFKARCSPRLIGPGAPGVSVLLRHNGRKEPVGGTEVDRELELQEGRNDLEIVAVNEGADRGELQRFETNSRRLVLYYTPKHTRPTITLLSVKLPSGEEVPLQPDRPLRVPSRMVRIMGQIHAKDEDLTEATVVRGREKRALAKFKKGKTFRIDEGVEFQNPGKTELEFRAETRATEAEPQTVVLEWVPELPRFRLLSDAVVDADAPLEVELVGRFEGPQEVYPFKVSKLLVNGKPVGPLPDLSRFQENRQLKVRVPLAPGANRIELELGNGWGKPRTEVVSVYRRQPPHVRSLRVVNNAAGQSATFEAEVETAAEQVLTGRFGRTAVADRTFDSNDVEWRSLKDLKFVAQGGKWVWQAKIPAAPLAKGDNTFKLEVSNADGRAERSVTVKGSLPPPPRPQITLRGLPATPVAQANCPLTIDVRSVRDSFSVQLWHNEQNVTDTVLPEPEVDEGGRVYHIERLPLKAGLNTLKVVAANAGGPREASAIVSYVVPTAKVRLDGYTVAEGALRPMDTPAPEGNVVLHGHLEWPTEDDPCLRRRPLRVRVWVNDFEQGDAELEEAHERKRSFSLPLVLNRAVNQVDVGVPAEVKLEEGDPHGGRLLCDKPERQQRLHLLIVAPEIKKRKYLDDLIERVLKAFGGTEARGTAFRAPAFVAGAAYYSLCAEDGPDSVDSHLYHIKNTIRQSAGNYSDVVIVYFQGKTATRDGKTYLLWTGPPGARPEDSNAINTEHIRDFLNDVLGAKLLLLDISGAKEEPRPTVKGGRRIGDLQYLWLGQDAPDQAHRGFLRDLQNSLVHAHVWGDLVAQLLRAASTEKKVLASSPEGYRDIPLRAPLRENQP